VHALVPPPGEGRRYRCFKKADELPDCTLLHSAIPGESADTAMAPKRPYQEESVAAALLLKRAVTIQKIHKYHLKILNT